MTNNVIDDDGKTLWVSPTDGPQLDLSYLPPGVQIVVSINAAALRQHPEGEKLAAALGPIGQRIKTQLDQMRVPFEQVNQLVIGLQATSDGNWPATIVARTGRPMTLEKLASANVGKLSTYQNHEYLAGGELAYYLPTRDRTVLVVAPADSIRDIIDLAGDPPPLRRDVERLLAHTDADRQVTILFTPNSLFAEGRSLIESEVPRMREPLFWFLGDELSAAALSLHWNENFFFELIATPTLETSTERAARILMERLAEVPAKVKQYVATLQPTPYGREVVARFPAMLEQLTAYARSGFDKDHAVVRGYLPAVAGHNLLLAAELTLAEPPAGTLPIIAAAPSAETPASDSKTVHERLQQSTSLRFPRDTLEAALNQLSEDIGVEIVIRGPDLQADGITKNQSFGIDVADKPAEQILVEILRLANPDKTATGPGDEKQKLVYVIQPSETGAEQVVITTRAAATARGDELPAVFRVGQ